MKNNDIINVHFDKLSSCFGVEWKQKLLHEALEGNRGIGQNKWHDFKFIQPLMCDDVDKKRAFPNWSKRSSIQGRG